MNAIIGMGLQHAYLNKNGKFYLGEKGEKLKENLKVFFERNSTNSVVFFTREIHSVDDPFFKSIVTHSIVGTEDINLVESLKCYSKFIINVTRYNAFFRTQLESEIKKYSFEKIILVGVETHTNILFTAEEFRNRDYNNVVIYNDLVTSRDEYMHSVGINLLVNVLSVDLI